MYTMTVTMDRAENRQTSVDPMASMTSLSTSWTSELNRLRMRPRGVRSNHPTGACMTFFVRASCMAVDALNDARLWTSDLVS